jgi:hypothetical protein
MITSYPNATFTISEFYHFNHWGGRKEAMRARGARKKQLESLGWTDIRISTNGSAYSDLGQYCYISAQRPIAADVLFRPISHTSDGANVTRVMPDRIPTLPEGPWRPDFSHCELSLYTHNEERGPYIALNVDLTRKHYHDRGHEESSDGSYHISWADWKRGVRTCMGLQDQLVDFTIATNYRAEMQKTA